MIKFMSYHTGVDLTPPGRIDKNKVKYVYNKLNIPENNRIILYTGSLSELHGTPFFNESYWLCDQKKTGCFIFNFRKGGVRK